MVHRGDAHLEHSGRTLRWTNPSVTIENYAPANCSLQIDLCAFFSCTRITLLQLMRHSQVANLRCVIASLHYALINCTHAGQMRSDDDEKVNNKQICRRGHQGLAIRHALARREMESRMTGRINHMKADNEFPRPNRIGYSSPFRGK